MDFARKYLPSTILLLALLVMPDANAAMVSAPEGSEAARLRIICMEHPQASHEQTQTQERVCVERGGVWSGRDQWSSYAWQAKREHDYWSMVRWVAPLSLLSVALVGFLLHRTRRRVGAAAENLTISIGAAALRFARKVSSGLRSLGGKITERANE